MFIFILLWRTSRASTSSSSCLPLSMRVEIWTFRVLISADRDLFLALEASSFFFTSSWSLRRSSCSAEIFCVVCWKSRVLKHMNTTNGKDDFWRYTDLKRFSLHLLNGANIADVFVLSGDFCNGLKVFVSIQDTWCLLSWLVQLLLEGPYLSDNVHFYSSVVFLLFSDYYLCH